MTSSRMFFQTTAVALLALAPMHVKAELLSGNVDVDRNGASADVTLGSHDSVDADANVSLGGGGNGGNDADVDADVSLGGGGADADVSVGVGGGAGGGVSIGGGGDNDGSSGSGSNDGDSGSGGGGSTTDVAEGGGSGGSSDGADGSGGTGGGGSSTGVDASSDASALVLGNGQPAAILIGIVVWSSDGVALGVVRDIAGFDGTNLRLEIVPNASLGLPHSVVLIDVPVSRLTARELRLSMTRAEFVRTVSA